MPSFQRRFFAVVIRTLFLPLLRIANNRFKNSADSEGSSETLAVLRVLSNNLEPLVDIVKRLNVALFYVQRRYYTSSKRATGVKYVRFVAAKAAAADGDATKFDVIGRILSLRAYLEFITQARKFSSELQQNEESKRRQKAEKDDISGGGKDSETCVLCMSPYRDISVTRCGHVFCWQCVHHWLLSNSDCPLCREHLLPREVVALQNF